MYSCMENLCSSEQYLGVYICCYIKDIINYVLKEDYQNKKNYLVKYQILTIHLK